MHERIELPAFNGRGHYEVKNAPFPIVMNLENMPHYCKNLADGKFIRAHKDLERGIYRISYPIDELQVGNYSGEARHHVFLQVYKDPEGVDKRRCLVFYVDGNGYDKGSHAVMQENYSINVNAPGVVVAPIVTESDVTELGGKWTDPEIGKLKKTIESLIKELRSVPYHFFKRNSKTAANRATEEALRLLNYDNYPAMKEAMTNLAEERLKYPINTNSSIPKVFRQAFVNPSKHSVAEKIKYTGEFLEHFFGMATAKRILRSVGSVVDVLPPRRKCVDVVRESTVESRKTGSKSKKKSKNTVPASLDTKLDNDLSNMSNYYRRREGRSISAMKKSASELQSLGGFHNSIFVGMRN